MCVAYIQITEVYLANLLFLFLGYSEQNLSLLASAQFLAKFLEWKLDKKER
jgi:hypothetical protein